MSHLQPPPRRRRSDRHRSAAPTGPVPGPAVPPGPAPRPAVPEHPAPQRPAARARARRPLTLLGAVLLVVLLVAATLGGLAWWARHRAPLLGQSAQSGSVFERIQVSGRQGATPVVTVTGPLDVAGDKYRTLEVGGGRTITEDSPVVLSLTAFDGADGSLLSDGGPEVRVGRATPGGIGDLLSRAVVGAREGSRILFVRSIDPAHRAQGATSAVEVDVVDVLASIATGRAQPAAKGDPLSVTLGDDGPVITHSGAPPSDLTTQVLLRGDGPQVGEGDRVVVQFILTGWSDGSVRASTWSTGVPELVDLTQAMPGLRDALVDQRVGSRIAVTIPPDQAQGDDTLCAVVDVLATSRPSD